MNIRAHGRRIARSRRPDRGLADQTMSDEEEIEQEIRGHHARNAALADRLRELGVDLRAERIIEHHFWVPDSEEGRRLIDALQERGFSVTTELAEDGFVSVTGARLSPPVEACSETSVDSLVRLAIRFGGVYDGWGTAV